MDFHAHILPGADHGSPNLDHSLRQLNCAAKAGIKTIVATPHYYTSDGISVSDFAEMRAATADTLERHSGAGINIIQAAEVYLSHETAELEHLPMLCVGNTDYILIEMPYGIWDSGIFDVLLSVVSARCLVPIIAHVDRYSPDNLQKLLTFGFTMQVNAEAVCRRFSRKRLIPYIKSGEISLLGSDVHDMPEYSYSRFTRAAALLSDNITAMTAKASLILGIQHPV